jgi:hypothetical protein
MGYNKNRKMKKVIIAGLCFLFLSGCYSVKMSTPYDSKVELASKTDMLPFKENKTNWFFLYGIIPLSGNKVETTIRENGLTKVRLQTKIRVADFFISLFPSIILISTNTTVIEGARE